MRFYSYSRHMNMSKSVRPLYWMNTRKHCNLSERKL